MIARCTRRVLLSGIAASALAARAFAGGAEPRAIRTADGRRCVVTRWRPRERRGTILFSHGALSAPGKYTALIAPWVAAGYEVWAPLHVDSTDHPDTKAFPGLASWAARMEDMRALADHLGGERYVAAGHSYGALVALTLAGASPVRPSGVAGRLRDGRAPCALAFSPPGPGMGLIDAAGYATVATPALIQTGTADIPPGATDPSSWRGHLAAYEAPPAGGARYALVLDGVDHYFGGIICRPELAGPRPTAQFERAVATSTLFLEAYCVGSARARAALLRQVDGRTLSLR